MKEIALTLPGYPQGITPPPNIPAGASAPSNVLQFGITMIFFAVLTAALIFTLYGGILWVTSSGDKQKLDKARRTIMFSIIGVIIAVSAFAIIQVTGDLLGNRFLSKFGADESMVDPRDPGFLPNP